MIKKIILLLVLLAAGAVAYFGFRATRKAPIEENVRIFVPRNATSDDLRDTLATRLGESFGASVYQAWETLGGDIVKSRGSFVISPGSKAYEVANQIAKGRQSPVKVTLNVARTLDDMAAELSRNIEASPDEIVNAMDSVLAGDPQYGGRERYTAAILPDTYEFYWNVEPRQAVKTLIYWRDKFWNDERLAKANKIGLSPAQVVTLASIVEEESKLADEQPVIAGLYLNRLKKGMRLQADPTVKFAIGDFTLRRITGKHLEINSPYNTYKVSGLPPGPIRVPQKATIDAVLNAKPSNYLYMCAKEDFSGRHNFTASYDEHLANARRYAAALDRRGIR